MAFRFHNVAPSIPVRYHYSGNEKKAKALTSVGDKRLNDLITSLQFQKLPSGRNSLVLSDGSLIETFFSYGTSIVKIKTPVVPVVPVEHEVNKMNNMKYLVIIKKLTVLQRVIVWSLAFGAIDPEQTDMNRDKGFIPGGGFIVLDVDIVERIVYSPEGIVDEDDITYYVDLANEYLDIHRANRYDQGDYYAQKDLSNPAEAHNYCAREAAGGGYVDHLGYSLQINEFIPYECDSITYEFMHMMEAVPDDYLERLYWMDDHCPCEGGNPDFNRHYTYWNKIDDNAPYYGDLTYMPNTMLSSSHYKSVPYSCPIPGKDPDSPYTADGTYAVCTQIVTGDLYTRPYTGILNDGGESFVAWNEVWEYPCFFMFYKATTYFLDQEQYYIAWSEDGSDNWDTAVDGIHAYLGKASQGRQLNDVTLVTPLEEILVEEFTSFKTGSVPLCNDTDCLNYYDYEVQGGNSRIGMADGEPFVDCFPCQVIRGAGDYPIEFGHEFYKMRKVHDPIIDRVNYLRMLDPESLDDIVEAGYMGPTHLSSLCHLYENQDARTSYVTLLWQNNVTLEHVFCNKIDYTESGEDLPVNYSSTTGIVIYIFVPEYFTTLSDPEDPESDLVYWDIHSARHETSAINPYRILDLEEYVIESLEGMQQVFRESGEVAKRTSADPDSIYPMLEYGYSLDFGFAFKP